MIELTLNGQQVQAEDGSTLLQVAAAQGIRIPTLCYHEGLPAYGACRMCVVEVSSRGRARLESACTRQAEAGMDVRTDTDELKEYRKLIAELLLARCPDSERIRELAREVGATETRFEPLDEDCVLCGLCVRACQDAIGVSAISFMNRGMERKVGTPFSINSDVCVGCGACAQVCPTGAITVEDVGDKRYLRYFNTELELERCAGCGARFTTKRRAEKTKEDHDTPEPLRSLCPDCRRKRSAVALRRYVL